MAEMYAEQFSPAHDFPLRAESETYYVIASTPRCGSHLLGHTMYQTGVLGFPLEYFNPINLPHWSDRFGTTDFHDTYAAIRAHRTSPNGCFGAKLHYSHYRQLIRDHRFEDLFPRVRVIHLERDDLLGQAVSLAKARQTQSWIAAQSPQAVPDYDASAIDRAMSDIVTANASWRVETSIHPWPTLRITYEDFLADPTAVVRRIALFLSVDLDARRDQTIQLPERQSDTTNRTWIERYRGQPDKEPNIVVNIGNGNLHNARSGSASHLRRHLRGVRSFIRELRRRLIE